MSYTPPYDNFIANLAGVHYGLVHLGLATTAYTYEGFPLSIASQMASFIPQLPLISDIPGAAYWSLDWGPALCPDSGGFFNDNLVAIVSYRQGTSPSGTPSFFAVICRGTDTLGGIAQISEDLDAFTQQTWADVLNGTYTFGGATNGLTIQTEITNPPNGGVIASGSANALIAVSNLVPYSALTEGPASYLGPSLIGLLAQYPGTPVVVTGHSLGGALTQVVAGYLSCLLTQNQVSSQVIPQAFAPPTVGDSGFATWYNGVFKSGGQFWVNSNDLVPCAFAQPYFDSLATLWGDYQWPDDGGDGPTVFGTGDTLAKRIELKTEQKELVSLVAKRLPSYARPANVQLMPSPASTTLPTQAQMTAFLTNLGQNPATWNTWAAVLQYQHLPPTYYTLVSDVSGVLPYSFVSIPKPPPFV